jgi:hypothetical protein
MKTQNHKENMHSSDKYSAERVFIAPEDKAIWSACMFDGKLYAGMSFKSGSGAPGLLVVDVGTMYVEREYTDFGRVRFVGALNNALVIGGSGGLIIRRCGRKDVMTPVTGGVNTAAVVDDDTLIVGGFKYLGLYSLSSDTLAPYPFGPEDILYMEEIHAIAVMPECFALGRDVDSLILHSPAVGFLRKDIEKKGEEVDQLFMSRTKQELAKLVKPASFHDHLMTFPTLSRVIMALLDRRPGYVRDMQFCNGSLIVVEFGEAYAIKHPAGGKRSFRHGGFSVAQNPYDSDEAWIGGTGGGVMALSYLKKQGEWYENQRASVEINNAILKAYGSEEDRRLYISCVYFMQDKVLVSTETRGTYFVRKTGKQQIPELPSSKRNKHR